MRRSRIVVAKVVAASQSRRRGNIVVMSAGAVVIAVAFTAFVVDVGYIATTRAQLQNGADASSMAAATELTAAFGHGPTATFPEAEQLARQAAVDVAALNRAAERSSIYANYDRDVRFGRYEWDPNAETWQKVWGIPPYNMAEVTLHRDTALTPEGLPNTGGDVPLSLFFAPVIGHEMAGVAVTATAAMLPGVGFRIEENSGLTVGILPITLDEATWNDLLDGTGEDDYSYNPETGNVSNGSDGILELNLYPELDALLPSGNRGTLDIGASNNSTQDLARQILHGVNEDDLSYFGGELRFDEGPLEMDGDTGISAGIKDELEAIIGLPRAIPIFTQVVNPGDNATYTVIKFVGIRVMGVKLTGPPHKKHVTIQPAPYYSGTVIPGEVTLEEDSILAPARLVL